MSMNNAGPDDTTDLSFTYKEYGKLPPPSSRLILYLSLLRFFRNFDIDLELIVT